MNESAKRKQSKSKRKKRITVTLEGPIVDFIKRCSLLAGESQDAVLSVLLAAAILRPRGGKDA